MREAMFRTIDDLDMANWSSSVSVEGSDLSSLYEGVPEEYRPRTTPRGFCGDDLAASPSVQGGGFYSASGLKQFRRFAGNQSRTHPYHRHGGRGLYGHPVNAPRFGLRGVGSSGPRFPPPPHSFQNQYRNVLLDLGCPQQHLQPRYYPEGDFVLPPTATMLTDMGLPLPELNTQGDTSDNDIDHTSSDGDSDDPSSSSSADSVLGSSDELDSELEELLYGEEGEDKDSCVSDCLNSRDAQGSKISDGSQPSHVSTCPQTSSDDVTCPSCGRVLVSGQSKHRTAPKDQSLFQKLDHLVQSFDSVCTCSNQNLTALERNSQNCEDQSALYQTHLHPAHNEQELERDAHNCEQIAVLPDTADERTVYDLTTVTPTLSQTSANVCDVSDKGSNGKCLQRQFSTEVTVVTRRMGECGL